MVVNSDMTIIGGHQRLTVGMALGYTEVPCAVVDIDKVREKALNIALNKITGAWDESLLADLLEDIQNSDFDLGKTGFEPPEIETLFNKVHDKDVKEDDFDVGEELKKPCFSNPGDIWHLGRHKVICGDSTLPETYQALLEGVKVNLILTDPPYNVDVEETAGKIMNDNMSKEDFYKFLLSAFTPMHDAIADDGSIYVFHADTEGLNFRRAFDDEGSSVITGTTLENQQGVVTLNGKSQTFRNSSASFFYAGTTITDFLFATNSGYSAEYPFQGRLYYVRFYDNTGTLVRNFEPCVRTSDNKPGMYDTVHSLSTVAATHLCSTSFTDTVQQLRHRF